MNVYRKTDSSVIRIFANSTSARSASQKLSKKDEYTLLFKNFHLYKCIIYYLTFNLNIYIYIYIYIYMYLMIYLIYLYIYIYLYLLHYKV